MKEINWKTKRAREMFKNWLYSNDRSLDAVYAKCSSEKVGAWSYCNKLCDKYNGRDLVITGHNTTMFSAAFICGDEFDEKLVYITRYNDYIFDASLYMLEARNM